MPTHRLERSSLDRTSPSALRPETPRALDELVLRCLRYAPARRFANAGAALAALDSLPGH